VYILKFNINVVGKMIQLCIRIFLFT